ncbi:MAG: hypothetical protein D4R77_14345 [Planctomycetaceae bacterium]|nr:MAG: hypothetical protein D4R77_14345 [Planctomycetaceae bacterium]
MSIIPFDTSTPTSSKPLSTKTLSWRAFWRYFYGDSQQRGIFLSNRFPNASGCVNSLRHTEHLTL